MASKEISVPQMGEGLTEVRILELRKQPGESVHRDEILYTMETDKATMEVESPESGTLVEWLAAEGDVVPIGAAIARLETAASATQPEASDSRPEASPVAEPQAATPPTEDGPQRIVPPRTRAYGKEHGISTEEMQAIPSVGGKLMPSDIDAYLALRSSPTPDSGESFYQDRSLSPRQRVFVYRLKRSAQVVIPGTIHLPVEWTTLRRYVEGERERDAPLHPTEFQVFAYCAARCAPAFPKFRSILLNDETVREFAHLNLGVAVACPNGDLTTAVVQDADTLEYGAFIPTLQGKITAARDGEDQANGSVQLLLTTLGKYGVVDAVPVLVAPAVAILFLGAPYMREGTAFVNLACTFDHRLINGVEAAEFLSAVAERVREPAKK